MIATIDSQAGQWIVATLTFLVAILFICAFPKARTEPEITQ